MASKIAVSMEWAQCDLGIGWGDLELKSIIDTRKSVNARTEVDKGLIVDYDGLAPGYGLWERETRIR